MKHFIYPAKELESAQALDVQGKYSNHETNYRAYETSYRGYEMFDWRNVTASWRKTTEGSRSETFFWPISANMVAI